MPQLLCWFYHRLIDFRWCSPPMPARGNPLPRACTRTRDGNICALRLRLSGGAGAGAGAGAVPVTRGAGRSSCRWAPWTESRSRCDAPSGDSLAFCAWGRPECGGLTLGRMSRRGTRHSARATRRTCWSTSPASRPAPASRLAALPPLARLLSSPPPPTDTGRKEDRLARDAAAQRAGGMG